MYCLRCNNSTYSTSGFYASLHVIVLFGLLLSEKFKSVLDFVMWKHGVGKFEEGGFPEETFPQYAHPCAH